MALVYAAIIGAGVLYLTRSWPPSARAIAWLRVMWPRVLGYFRSSPAVVTYTAILVVTTSIYTSIPPSVGRILLRNQSTNLRQLSHDPIRVLISSAFWTGGSTMWHVILPFAIILTPLERWLGTPRFLSVFWLGHVGTTIIVALGIWLAIHYGDAPDSLSRVIDVGVSYGKYCCYGVFTYRLAMRYRILWAAGWSAFLLFEVVYSGTFTDYGHLVTLALGFALYRVTQAPDVRRRALEPIWPGRFGSFAQARPATV